LSLDGLQPDHRASRNGARPSKVVHLALAHDSRDVRVFEKEAVALASAGYDVSVVAPGAEDGVERGVRLVSLPPAARARGARAAAGRLRTIFDAAASLNPDLVHLHEPELVPVGLALRRCGIKIVYDAHEDAPLEALGINRHRPAKGYALAALWRCHLALAVRTFDGFVAATPDIARGLPAGRTATVRNFPSLERVRPGDLPMASRPPRIAYVGTIAVARGLLEVLDAMAALPPDDPAELLLVGAFKPEKLGAEARRHPGWTRVRHLGWRSWDEVLALLDECRVGLVTLHPTPETVTSLPVKLFEYMAKGLPVVASDIPMWREIVEGAGAGLAVDPRDPAAIGRALARLLSSPDEAARMGQAGRAAAVARYSWDGEAAKLIGLYERVLGPS
jgi:glycosyltransferase involved in cell wall biosynthesis